MISILNPLREITMLSIALRLLLAVFCGGLIGLEREYKRRPAGFRTHILICLGASMTTLTSQYLLLVLHAYTDIARLGAQVIAGIGFIGAGTIIVTRRQHVKGLTTAAGLWTSAIIGLALGAGFYEAGVLTTFLVLVAELVFAKLEYRMLESPLELFLYMEYEGRQCVDSVLSFCRQHDMRLLDIEITRNSDGGRSIACAVFTLRLNHKHKSDWVLTQLQSIPGVTAIHEL